MTSWTERAFIRTGGDPVFSPPEDQRQHRRWHMIGTHRGTERMQWRAGIWVWHDAEGQRWTDRTAAELGWRYVCVADDQSGGEP
jgi:hypothetical protein